MYRDTAFCSQFIIEYSIKIVVKEKPNECVDVYFMFGQKHVTDLLHTSNEIYLDETTCIVDLSKPYVYLWIVWTSRQ